MYKNVSLVQAEVPMVSIGLLSKALLSQKCAVIGCTNKDIEVHHIRALKRVIHGYLVESIKSKNKSLRGSSKIESALNRKKFLYVVSIMLNGLNWISLKLTSST